jgi:hypothetical protein
MPINIEIGKMFGWIDNTWNPVVGCLHNCNYCWARKLALGRLKTKPRYLLGFKPQLIEHELSRRFYDQKVFVTDMGDLFGDWVKREWIEKVIEAITKSPTSTFLLLTKNPKRFNEFVNNIPKNVILGTTIETNKDYPTSSGVIHSPQSRVQRYLSMKTLEYNRKFVAIEPLMDFDPTVLERWIREINPERVSVSYDNYHNELPVPTNDNAIRLCKRLASFTNVLPHGEWVKDKTTRTKLRV